MDKGKEKKFKLDVMALVLLIITFVMPPLMYFQVMNTFNLGIQDFFYQETSNMSSDIVVVTIDDESITQLGRWPWNRTMYAEFLNKLSDANVAAIGIDVIFAENSNSESDMEFAKAAERAGNVIIPMYADLKFKENAEGQRSIYAEYVNYPIKPLADASILAHINVLTDKDGILRRWIPQIYYSESGSNVKAFPWMIYETYCKNRGIEPITFESLPRDKDSMTEISYSSPMDINDTSLDGIEHISFCKVLRGEVPAEYFEGKMVLVGPAAIGIADDYYYTAISHSKQTYGIDVHANIINQILKNKFYSRVDMGIQALAMLILGLLSTALYCFKRDVQSLIKLFIVTAIFLVALYTLKHNMLMMNILHFAMLIFLQYVGQLTVGYIYEKTEKHKIKKLFGKYMTPDLIDLMLDGKSETEVKLGGEKREITVLFVDIRGFTTMSESVEPEEVVLILNDYLTLCAKSIFDYGGILDKYIGDAAMGVYNAPFNLENHCLMAVKSAWAMSSGSEELNKKLFEKTGHTIQFGVGINTGFAVVGNIGAEFRMDYTAIGDTVNTAARIESNSKGGQILISEAVYEKVKDYVEVLDLGTINVKGKANGVSIYQVIGVEEQ
ncbi:MAG: CHASE2 domain-containing protein [Eubacteriales bacterium]